MPATNGTAIADVISQSVTAQDYEARPAGGPGVFFVARPHDRDAELPLTPPAYWTKDRDRQLRKTPFYANMWAVALNKVATRVASFGWLIEDVAKSTRRVKRSHSLLHESGFGDGWVPFVSKLVKDFSCTDNGCFIEIIRQTGARGSRVIGIQHLDSLRCWRTGDPTQPAIYVDLQGRSHVLKDYQVIALADSPSSNVELCGVGQCAASRAYDAIVRLSYADRYVAEKLSGKALAVHFINGIPSSTLADALRGGEAAAVAEGFTRYFGSTFIPTMRPDPVEVATVDLAGLPDRVDIQQVLSTCYLVIAHALGIFIGELEPLAGQYGTGTQSVILTEAAQGQGMAALLTMLETRLSRDVLPTTTTITFTNEKDVREQKAKAEVTKLRVETRKTQLESGELASTDEARQMAADDGDIDRMFLESYQDDSLSSEEKPVPVTVEEAEGDGTVGEHGWMRQLLSGKARKPTAFDAAALLKQEQAASARLYRKVKRG